MKYLCFHKAFVAVLACLLLAACQSGDPSTAVAGSEGPLVIYPDYKDVTIPANIAPLNFRYAMEGVRKATTTFTLDGRSVTFRGTEVEWPLRKWKAFLDLKKEFDTLCGTNIYRLFRDEISQRIFAEPAK